MQRFCDEYPELAAMFQALQDGVTECRPHEKRLAKSKYELEDAKAIGRRLGLIAWQYDATDSAVAAGLRMVADAIGPPAMVDAQARDCRDARAIDAYAGRMGGSACGPKQGTGQIELTRPGNGPPPRTRGDKQQKAPVLTGALVIQVPSQTGYSMSSIGADLRHRIALGSGVSGGLGSDGVGVLYVLVERAQLGLCIPAQAAFGLQHVVKLGGGAGLGVDLQLLVLGVDGDKAFQTGSWAPPSGRLAAIIPKGPPGKPKTPTGQRRTRLCETRVHCTTKRPPRSIRRGQTAGR